MWLSIDQDSELINTDRFAQVGTFAVFDVLTSATQDAVNELDEPRYVSRAVNQVQVYVPLRRLSSNEPTQPQLRQLLSTAFLNDAPATGWRLHSYALAFTDEFTVNGSPWDSLTIRGWNVLCHAPSASFADILRQEILNLRSPGLTKSLDDCIVDELLARALRSITNTIPWYYGYLLPALQGRNGCQFEVDYTLIDPLNEPANQSSSTSINETTAQAQQPNQPANRLVAIDGLANEESPAITYVCTYDEVEPIVTTHLERVLNTLTAISTYLDLGIPADQLLERLLCNESLYDEVINRNLTRLTSMMSDADDRAMLNDLLAYIYNNSSWD